MPKFKTGCPGQNTAYLKDFNTNIIPCPKCGKEIEFFADERKVKCSKCGSSVFKINPQVMDYKDGKLIFYESEKSCLDWCGGCLEKNDYKDIQENVKRIGQKKQDIDKLISLVDKKDLEVIEFFIDSFRKSINHPALIDPGIFDILKKSKPELFIRARNYYLTFLNNK
jgi:DNA-directed RNA polymerase subunit RPC12/RpoP